MMLVRTESGYEPAPMRAVEQFVWDQPLHPEREATTPDPRPEPHLARQRTHNGNGNGHATAAAAGAQSPTAPVEHAPEPAPAVEPSTVEPSIVVSSISPDEHRDPAGASISKKAVAVGILLALGLPLSGKMLDLTRGRREGTTGTSSTGAAAGPVLPLALTANRSGFSQVSPDAARYVAVIRNPNRDVAANGVSVSISLYGPGGRLVGTAAERLAGVPAGGSVAVAGETGVSGRVVTLGARVETVSFDAAGVVPPFVVRGSQMSHTPGGILVRTAVSGASAVRDARVVVVYLDRNGRIVGGDFTYVDVPPSPRTAAAVVETSGLGSTVHHVEVYVVASR